MSSPLYPVALNLAGRRCVVVGGGAVGRRRAEGLLTCGASVIVVDPASVDAPAGAQHRAERFEPGHLDGAFLAVAATGDPGVNAAVAKAARERGALVNLAAPGEDDDGGDFVTLAAVRRGDLLIGITTGGAGPALAARLRRELEARFPEIWGEYVALLAEGRRDAKDRVADPAERARRLRHLADDETVLAALTAGDREAARARAQEALSCPS